MCPTHTQTQTTERTTSVAIGRIYTMHAMESTKSSHYFLKDISIPNVLISKLNN